MDNANLVEVSFNGRVYALDFAGKHYNAELTHCWEGVTVRDEHKKRITTVPFEKNWQRTVEGALRAIASQKAVA